MTNAQAEARAIGDVFSELFGAPYMRIVDFFDRDETAGSFLREDGEGGFVGGIYRMAREIESLRASSAAKDAEIAALKKEAADVVRPFAKIADGEPDNAVFHTGHKVFKAARSFLDKWEGRDG